MAAPGATHLSQKKGWTMQGITTSQPERAEPVFKRLYLPTPTPPPPQEPFLCPRCQKLQGPGARCGGRPLTVEFARASGGETAWRLAQLLATTDYRWGGAQGVGH